MQSFKSKDTSINSTRVPALFKYIDWDKWVREFPHAGQMRNLDMGGGKYNTATKYLDSFNVKNLVFDPYNCSFDDNLRVVMEVAINPAETATISNVLCVIKEKEKRIELLERAKRWAKVVFISVYEGDKSGIGRETKRGGWQENRKLSSYISEVEEVFPYVGIKGNHIIAF